MRKKFILNLNINHFCENLIYVNKLKTHILIINFTQNYKLTLLLKIID